MSIKNKSLNEVNELRKIIKLLCFSDPIAQESNRQPDFVCQLLCMIHAFRSLTILILRTAFVDSAGNSGNAFNFQQI
jgi:hypothetical protein